MAAPDIPTYKVVLMGPSGVGKTRWVDSHFDLEDHPQIQSRASKHIPTLGMEVHPIVYDEKVCLRIWDTAGDPKFGGLRDGYYTNADLGVFVYNDNEEDLEPYRKGFQATAPGKPSMVVNAEEMHQPGFVNRMMEQLE